VHQLLNRSLKIQGFFCRTPQARSARVRTAVKIGQNIRRNFSAESDSAPFDLD
jgi:hypothetical protein